MRIHKLMATFIVALTALSPVLLTCQFLAHAGQAQEDKGKAVPKKGPVDEKAIRALIAQLGDERYDKREEAEKKLIAVGKRAAPLVKKAATESNDAEVRERATGVLRILADYSPINFQTVTNRKLKDPLAGGAPGNTLDLSPGEHRFLGIPFQIGEGLLEVRSTKLLNRPAKIGGIRVGRKLNSLHFLHATHWTVDNQVKVGNYTIHYADGSSATIPIVYGKDTTCWWKYPDHKAPTVAEIAWKGTNPRANQFGATVWLVLSNWKNPKPNTPVTTIDFSTTDTPCAPFCVAITAEESVE